VITEDEMSFFDKEEVGNCTQPDGPLTKERDGWIRRDSPRYQKREKSN
jgi:hypothetical protein